MRSKVIKLSVLKHARMTKLAKPPNCQYVGYGHTIESVHGDLVHPPNLTGALSKGHMFSS